jgi:YihY family inner membrane protein
MPDFGAVLRRVDELQQGFKPAAFIFAVIKKFGDDRGGALAAELTYYGFLSIFPSLLILTTVLGFVGNRDVSSSVIGSTLAQFPVIGQQIGKNAAHPLHGSGVGLAFGLLVLLYGVLGSTQSAQHAMAQVWNVPAVSRPGFFQRLARGLLFIGTLGLGMVATAVMSGFVTVDNQALIARAGAFLAMVVVNVGLYYAAFKVLTPKGVLARSLLPGAVVGGIGYSILLSVGTALVQHQLKHAEAVYGQFGLVLGLMAWLSLVARLTIYAAELNVVLARHLWPRGLTSPTTTPADKEVLRDLAHEEERTKEERVAVGFDPDRVGDATRDARRP